MKIYFPLRFPISFHIVGIIFRKELRSYFNSIIAYVVMIVFYALMGWFYAGNIFLNNTATLRDMFEYAGIIFLFIIPATTMRLLAEESKTGTIELLATKPLHDAEIVLGKFFASWAFIALTILPTLVYYLTIANVGGLDNGPVIGGYLGLLLMTGVLHRCRPAGVESYGKSNHRVYARPLFLRGSVFYR